MRALDTMGRVLLAVLVIAITATQVRLFCCCRCLHPLVAEFRECIWR